MSPKEHSYEIISKSIHQFMRTYDLSKLLTTDDERRTQGDHNSSPSSCSGELKIAEDQFEI